MQSTWGRILYRARRYDEAIAHLNRAIELEPRNAIAIGRLGDVYSVLGRYQEALQSYHKARALVNGPGDTYQARFARTRERMGDQREVRRILTELHGAGAPAVHAALGEADEAFALLFRALTARDEFLLFVKTDPDFDPLHSDPRWADLLRRMNLPPAPDPVGN